VESGKWIKIRLPAEEVLEYIEKCLRDQGVKFKVKKYFRGDVLRFIKIKVDLLKSITIHVYPGHCYVEVPSGMEYLKFKLNLLPKYVERTVPSELAPRRFERFNLMMKAQLLKRKIENARMGLIMTPIIAAILLLLTGSPTLTVLVILIALLIPVGGRFQPFKEWGIPILYFKYKRDLEKLRAEIRELSVSP